MWGMKDAHRSRECSQKELDASIQHDHRAMRRRETFKKWLVALQRLLESRGFRGSTVRVGARLERGHFTAHAWVEYQGHVLGDRDWHVQRFTPLAPIEVSHQS